MEQKDIDIYEILKGMPDGTPLYTPMCGNTTRKKYNKHNYDKNKSYWKQYYQEHKEKIQAYQKEYQKGYRERMRARARKRERPESLCMIFRKKSDRELYKVLARCAEERRKRGEG